MLCARVLADEKRERHGAIYRWNEAAFQRLQNEYDRTLRWALQHRQVILGVFAASVVASVALFEIMPQDFLPSDDTGQLRGSIQMATGTSFDQSIKYVRQVMDIVEKDPNVAGVQGDEGGEGGGFLAEALRDAVVFRDGEFGETVRKRADAFGQAFELLGGGDGCSVGEWFCAGGCGKEFAAVIAFGFLHARAGNAQQPAGFRADELVVRAKLVFEAVEVIAPTVEKVGG